MALKITVICKQVKLHQKTFEVYVYKVLLYDIHATTITLQCIVCHICVYLQIFRKHKHKKYTHSVFIVTITTNVSPFPTHLLALSTVHRRIL